MKKHKGISLIESMFAMLIISITVLGFFKTDVYIKKKTSEIEVNSYIDTLFINTAEKISYDLAQGIEITSQDYSHYDENVNITVKIEETDLFESPIYQIEMQIIYDKRTKETNTFYVRG